MYCNYRRDMDDMSSFTVRRGTRSDLSRYKVGSGMIDYRRKYTFSPVLLVDERYRQIRSEIFEMDRILGNIILSDKDYVSSMRDAFSANITSTLNEDGATVGFADIMDLVNLLHEVDADEIYEMTGLKREIVNYIRTFISASRGGSMPWNVGGIIRVHARLMEGVYSDIEPGVLRSDSYIIPDPSGQPKVVTCPPEFIKVELQSLLQWVRNTPFDPIATAVIFFAEFVGIRPFKHGNNRVGSTLAQLIMCTMGLKKIGFTKYEVWVYENRERFQNLLAYCLREQNYAPLIVHICESIHDAYVEAIERLSKKNVLSNADAHMKIIAQRAKDIGSEFSVSDCCRWIPDVKEQTVRSKLNALVECGVLDRKGNTRNTRYKFIEPFSELTNPLVDIAEDEV